ncbi:hypothetical protein BJ912DRAFT_89808 [Pholiota molesta]|nr:hypothetical protein BJ912DRAFT_89808 [Pholiota molesta]
MSFDVGLFVAMIDPQAAHYELRRCCELMYTFFVLDKYTDTLDANGARVHCDACMHAILHPDKPRPEGDPLIGEITRQHVFVSTEEI